MNTTKPGMPTWAKALIILGVIGVLFIGAIVIGGVAFFKYAQDQQADPANIKRLASQVCEFQDPLPAGFEFVRGQNLVQATAIQIDNKSKGMRIFLNCIEVKPGDSFNQGFRANFEKSFEEGLQSSGVTDFHPTANESVNIGGLPFDLKIGHCTARAATVPLMRARKELPGKIIIFVVSGPPGADFDLNLFKQFASSIKRF
jgi:hypothetical protein